MNSENFEKTNLGRVFYTIHLDNGESLSKTIIGYVSPHGTFIYSVRDALLQRIKTIIDRIEIGNIIYFAKNVTKVTIDKEEDYFV